MEKQTEKKTIKINVRKIIKYSVELRNSKVEISAKNEISIKSDELPNYVDTKYTMYFDFHDFECSETEERYCQYLNKNKNFLFKIVSKIYNLEFYIGKD